MDSLLKLYLLKTKQIQNNILDVLAMVANQRKHRPLDWMTGGRQVLVDKEIFESLQQFVVKVNRNMDQLSQMMDKSTAQADKLAEDNERLGQELSQSHKREAQLKKQLAVVRQLYAETKDKMVQMEIIQEMSAEQPTSGDQQRVNDFLKNSLALTLAFTHNQKTVQSITENQELFNSYMESLLAIVQKFTANGDADQDFELDDKSYEPSLIEDITGICVNVFLYSEYLCKDIEIWIQCLVRLQTMDKRFLKNVIVALHNICFQTGGTEAVAKQKGVVEVMARVLTDPDFKYDFKTKTYALKAVRRMVELMKGSDIDIFLFNEFTAVLPFERFHQMTVFEPNVVLKKAMTALYHSLSPLNMNGNIED